MLILIIYFSRLRQVYLTSLWNNPKSYFNLLESFASFMFKVSFMHVLWSKNHLWENLLNSFHAGSMKIIQQEMPLVRCSAFTSFLISVLP